MMDFNAIINPNLIYPFMYGIEYFFVVFYVGKAKFINFLKNQSKQKSRCNFYDSIYARLCRVNV